MSNLACRIGEIINDVINSQSLWSILLLLKKAPFQECGRWVFICGVLNHLAACPYLCIVKKFYSSHVGKSLVMTYNKIKFLWCELCFHLQPEWDVKLRCFATRARKHTLFLLKVKKVKTAEVDSLYQWHMLCMNNQWTTSPLKDVVQNHTLCSMYQAVHINDTLLHSV